jgi:hypothetical protein
MKGVRGEIDQSDAKKKQREKERADYLARRRRLAARRASLARAAQALANPFGLTTHFLQPGLANASARTR